MGIRVLRFLNDEFPVPHPPKTIATHAKAPYEGTKKWLARNEGRYVTNHKGTGWYRARSTLQLLQRIGIEPIKVHSIQVLLKSLGRGGPPALEGLGERRDDGTFRGVWRGRALTAQPTNDGGALVTLRATLQPLPVPEFCEFASFLEGIAAPGTADLVNVDVHVDVENHRLALRGANSMSLGEFRGALVKLYNKRELNATRLEVCFHRLDLDLGEAARLLNEVTTAPRPFAHEVWAPADGREVA